MLSPFTESSEGRTSEGLGKTRGRGIDHWIRTRHQTSWSSASRCRRWQLPTWVVLLCSRNGHGGSEAGRCHRWLPFLYPDGHHVTVNDLIPVTAWEPPANAQANEIDRYGSERTVSNR